jgi:hypothetical protein
LPGAREAGTADFVLGEGSDERAGGPVRLAELAVRLDDAAGTMRAGRSFVELEPAAQDEVLRALERAGSPEFGWLVETSMEGFYADPRHGGNRDGVSWQLLGFPGPTGGMGYSPPYGWYDANEPNLDAFGSDGSDRSDGSTHPTGTPQ